MPIIIDATRSDLMITEDWDVVKVMASIDTVFQDEESNTYTVNDIVEGMNVTYEPKWGGGIIIWNGTIVKKVLSGNNVTFYIQTENLDDLLG